MKRTMKCLAVAAALLASSAPGFSYQPQSSSSSSAATATPKKKTSSKKHHSKRESTQKVPTPARISEIQSALARDGYYQGEPNGKWDSNTVAAMQKFQSSNGLEASGKLNALSLQKLGLGSSIAGVGAPKPVQPPSSKPPASTSSPAAPASAPQSTSSANSSLASTSASPSTVAKPPQR
ncbi:MAG TPA: peptidoglycan-binding domain-containing protein [Candidatus Acidoferrales bacterium]|nr:peptidoglycan-binding domain-containing protein [Candidatus Acidoferrales bacterium]